jgi:4-hydroxy-tetrahydrodipicolinate reductase
MGAVTAMTKMIVCGAAGRMGRTLIQLIAAHPEARLHAAVEQAGHEAVGRDAGELAAVGKLGVTVSDDHASAAAADTVTLDFTSAAAAVEHLRSAATAGAAIVIGTTGFDDAQQEAIAALAPRTRCVIAPNMSVGVNVLLTLVGAAARVLGDDFDPEIVEIHHRLKVDAPSGTALALGRAVAAALGRDLRSDARFGREGIVGRREQREIGVMALRGGDVVGDHTVLFAGLGERLELTHRAQSRDCLARGALRAALWVESKPPGRYDMMDVLGLTRSA